MNRKNNPSPYALENDKRRFFRQKVSEGDMVLKMVKYREGLFV